MIHLRRLSQSFRHALRGVRVVLRTEQSFRIQAILAALAVVFLVLLRVPVFQAVVVLLMIAMVLVLELVNSIFERLVDTFKPRIHPVVGEIKDLMAAAVLIASVVAALIGLVVFVPPLLGLFSV